MSGPLPQKNNGWLKIQLVLMSNRVIKTIKIGSPNGS